MQLSSVASSTPRRLTGYNDNRPLKVVGQPTKLYTPTYETTFGG